jgi:hypothetical protein
MVPTAAVDMVLRRVTQRLLSWSSPLLVTLPVTNIAAFL